MHVPLIISGPQIKENQTSDALIELIDISATTLDLAGMEVPSQWDARSFAKILKKQNNSTHRKIQISQLNDWTMIFDGQYKLICTESQDDELFDLKADENECYNLAESLPEIVNNLKKKLKRELKQIVRSSDSI